ncbi:hypothetical protein K438DRAFT_1836390 [Mycena galopus ATCC 62051]|nr:hypothetical protein K438DRAFT_1836390 [Mycena galopus ATCC 62051]
MSEPIPRLPAELERRTFEIAAHSDLKSIPNLLLVAHRVKIWLEPILYSVVIFAGPTSRFFSFTPSRFSSTLHSRAFSQHVENLLCDYIREPLKPMLADCSAVKNFALLCPDPSALPLLSAMPLRCLHTGLKSLFRGTALDFTHPLFSHLTHLELTESLIGWQGLALIPNLTHLAFQHQISLSVFEGVLATCPTLRVLVCLLDFQDDSDLAKSLHSLVQDTRFVCMLSPNFVEDWEIGARRGEDFWVRAERFIAQCNSGEVDRGIFVLPRA